MEEEKNSLGVGYLERGKQENPDPTDLEYIDSLRTRTRIQ